MTRFLSLTVLSLLPAVTNAQVIIGQPRPAPRPAGVIQPPVLPIAGSQITRPAPAPLRPAPYLWVNPFGFYSGYPPLWPSWDEPAAPQPVVNNYFLIPTAPPKPAPEVQVATKARLVLYVPRDAEVTVAGIKADTRTRPVIVDSPDLKPGQKYVFDVTVKWKEGDKTEARTRQLTAEAGDEKSLRYVGGK